MNEKKKLFSREEWSLLLILAAIQFCHIVDFVIMMPLGPQLMRNFSIRPNQFGFLVSSYTFAAGISGLLTSFFVDRFDRKSCLQFFVTGFAIGTLACAFCKTYESLLLARFFTGYFGGVLGSLTLSVVGDNFAYEKRGTAMGIVMGAFSIASILGVPVSLALASHFSWHTPFVILGILAFLMLVLVTLLVPPLVRHMEHQGSRPNPLRVLGRILTNRYQVTALIFLFCLILGQFSIIPFLSQSLVSNVGLPENQLSIIYFVGGICSLFATPSWGRLSDRFGKRTIFLTSAMSSIPAILLVTHLVPIPLAYLLVCVSFFFISISGRMVPALAMVSATVHAETRGSFLSVASSAQQLSAALAAYIAGRIVVRDDSTGQLINYGHVGYVAAIFTVIAVGLVFYLKGPEGQDIT